MNAHIDRSQTCLDLRPATWPEARRVVFLVNVVQFWHPGLQNGAHTPDHIDKTEHFVETKRSFSQSGLLTSPSGPFFSASKTAIPHGTVALFDPPPAPHRSTSPRSRGVKFDLPGKATRRSGQRTVFVKMSVSPQRNDRFCGPNRRA